MKILLMIMTCEVQKNRRYNAIEFLNDIVKKRGHDYVFIGSIHESDDYVIKLSDEDDKISAVDKTINGLDYILKKYKFDYLMICDGDTYVNIPNLENFIETLDNEKLAIYGCIKPETDDHIDLHISGGSGILMNYKTAKTIDYAIKTYSDEYFKDDDYFVNWGKGYYSDVAISTYAKKHSEVTNDNIELIHNDLFKNQSIAGQILWDWIYSKEELRSYIGIHLQDFLAYENDITGFHKYLYE